MDPPHCVCASGSCGEWLAHAAGECILGDSRICVLRVTGLEDGHTALYLYNRGLRVSSSSDSTFSQIVEMNYRVT